MARELFLFFGLLSPFLVPIKLSFANVGLVSAILLWLYLYRDTVKGRITEQQQLYKPLGIFCFILLYSAVFGFDPLNSIYEFGKFFYLLAIIPLYGQLREEKYSLTIVLAVLLGQSFASIHTILETAFPLSIGEYSHGRVSEAGQLAITFLLSLGALFTLQIGEKKFHFSLKHWIPIIASSFAFTLLGFSEKLELSSLAINALLIISSLFIISASLKTYLLYKADEKDKALYVFLSAIAIPLLGAALFLNLKRGPWAGVFIGGIILFWRLAPRLLMYGLPISIISAFGIPPIRERILNAIEHFFAYGGRSTIWELGGELMVRYPLGIGLENSEHLNKFSHEIPEYLNHFHSNLVNITVELGWIGIVVYLWWLIVFIKKGFQSSTKTRDGILAFSATCGLISWQVAGLGEYNFGDSEVFLIAVIMMGLISARSDSTEANATSDG